MAEIPELKKLQLKSLDGEIFEFDELVAMESRTIKHLIEDTTVNNLIPIPNVEAEIMEKMIEYCKKHAEAAAGNTVPIAKISGPAGVDKELRKWDAEFMQVDQETLFDFMLDIKSLLDLTCQTVANMFMGKTPEEIRETFHIVNDYTLEEEDGVRKEIECAFN